MVAYPAYAQTRFAAVEPGSPALFAQSNMKARQAGAVVHLTPLPADDGDTDSEDDEREEEEWRLGFVEEPRIPAALQPEFFPSKVPECSAQQRPAATHHNQRKSLKGTLLQVGGAPAWLDPANLPSDLSCNAYPGGSRCGKPLVFLLQIYAPVMDGPPEAFHRSVFVSPPSSPHIFTYIGVPQRLPSAEASADAVSPGLRVLGRRMCRETGERACAPLPAAARKRALLI